LIGIAPPQCRSRRLVPLPKEGLRMRYYVCGLSLPNPHLASAQSRVCSRQFRVSRFIIFPPFPAPLPVCTGPASSSVDPTTPAPATHIPSHCPRFGPQLYNSQGRSLVWTRQLHCPVTALLLSPVTPCLLHRGASNSSLYLPCAPPGYYARLLSH
jgi:hypothetical protein